MWGQTRDIYCDYEPPGALWRILSDLSGSCAVDMHGVSWEGLGVGWGGEMARLPAELQGWPHSYPQMSRLFLIVTKGVDVVPLSVLAKLGEASKTSDCNGHFIPWWTWWWLKAGRPFHCSLLTGWPTIPIHRGSSFSNSPFSSVFSSSFIVFGDPGLLRFSYDLARLALNHEYVFSFLLFPQGEDKMVNWKA